MSCIMKFLSLLVIPNKNDMIMDVRNTHMASNNLKVKVLGNSVFIVNANKATLNIIADILVRTFLPYSVLLLPMCFLKKHKETNSMRELAILWIINTIRPSYPFSRER